MANIKHDQLTGNNLHLSKILLGSVSRPPAYVGEIVFDGSTLWIANGVEQTDWRPAIAASPPSFSWVVDRSTYEEGSSLQATRLTLFFKAISRAEANDYAREFDMLKTWIIGTDLGADSPINLTPFIEQKGKGCYVIAVNGSDGYGQTDQPFDGARLTTNSSAAVEFQITEAFVGVNAGEHGGLRGIEVINPFAQIILTLVQN